MNTIGKDAMKHSQTLYHVRVKNAQTELYEAEKAEMKRDIMEKKMKQAEKLQKENLQLVKLKVHENEMK